MQEQQRKIDKYTRKTRKQREGGTAIPFFLHRLRNGIEGANRRFWYGMLRMLLRNEPVTTKLPVEQLRSLLIIPYGDAIGDLLVSMTAARVIKRRNPNCKVGIITSHRNESILRCDPDFDEQYEFTGRSDRSNYGNLRRARRHHYQVVLNLHFQRMSDYGLISNYISRSGIKVSVQHKRGEMYRILFNHLSNATRFRVHLSQLGLKLLDDVVDFSRSPLLTWESKPIVHICPDVLAQVQMRLQALMNEMGVRWFIYVNPQARNHFREWGIQNNLQFCDAILGKYPEAGIVMTSSPIAQPDLVKALEAHGERRIRIVETSYDLNELAAVCRFSRMIVTPDTSVVHLASAESKPCIVFYPEHRETPREWLPLQVPSYQFGVTEQGHQVSSIPVAPVVEAAIELLEDRWQSTASSSGLRPDLPAAYQAANGQRNLIELIEPEISQGIH
ncbi:MAG TPA: glycosyltransferase family 9 protein [Candidatus Kapabacteria bacterium]|nr:glycosyltransferase family 9 protein [Candidatus Kapabacteria bacterium]